jgi:UDP-glucose 4-epimerase
MTILVTGSAGHLGEALMRTLRAQGRAVRGLDIKPSAFTDIVGSITDRSTARDAMRGVFGVIHTATLHKPHVATHSRQDFIDSNVSGTLVLLEEAVSAGVRAFVFTSTTSAFGAALKPAAGEPAAWITEDVVPVPKNIYGVTKLAAESLCELFFRSHGLTAIILRTSRFFPEEDDDADIRGRYSRDNAQANEMLYRRGDIADMVDAHLLALDRAARIGFARLIVSATTPFTRTDLDELRRDTPAVVRRIFPRFEALYALRRWTMFPSLDRVYDNTVVRDVLGWQPRYGFAQVLQSLERNEDFRSPLAIAIGSKGYHDAAFSDGPYPVTDTSGSR